jgi:hypothetical protein
MPEERYSSHRDYIDKVQEEANARQSNVETALREAFAEFIETRKVEVIVFTAMDVFALAKALEAHPLFLKPLLACCNIAARAIERDLGIKNVITYLPKFKPGQATAIAGYIKPFLPPYLEVPALSYLDRVGFIDKEIRKGKGNWEKEILRAANEFGKPRQFRKVLFEADGERYELDAAAFLESGEIEIGIDVKRIEARRDIHKRCDEIVRKADKLKSRYPQSKFGAVIYYPFLEEHTNVQSRLRSPSIDGIVFAAESTDSINNAVRLLLSTMGISGS